MAIYKDFVGLNYGVYDPTAEDDNVSSINQIGYDLDSLDLYSDASLPQPVVHSPHQTLSILNLHRNGPYGYPTWKQIRSSDNHLTRFQRKSNTFTYVEENGGKFGNIQSFTEPVVVDSYRPISLIGDIKVYNEQLNEFQNRSVELRTSFGNETAFFANSKVNDYFETIAETDENYEQLKELYLDGGLEDEGSPIDSFNMFIYRQSIYPKQQYVYLDQTRSRKYYVNTFWRDARKDRTQTDVNNGFQFTAPSQSMWPLDVAEDWTTRGIPSASTLANSNIFGYYLGGYLGGRTYAGVPVQIFGFNTGDDIGANHPSLHNISSASLGASGILMNSYSQIGRGTYNSSTTDKPGLNLNSSQPAVFSQVLSASCQYSRRHTMSTIESVVSPSGMEINETGSLTSIPTGSLFEGMAAWDAWKEKGKKPFYDSYEDFAQELRMKGKGFTTVPEFRISSHVETYQTKGVTEELREIFEVSGALSQNTTSENENSFYKILSNSDFLKHFDLIKKDHKNFADEKIISLKCKALKKFLPYEGFYPVQRSVDLAKRFVDSYGSNFSMVIDGFSSSSVDTSLKLQPMIEPLFAPGVLFNTIKSGIAVDYPIVIRDHLPQFINVNNDGRIDDASPRNNFMLQSSTEVTEPDAGPISQYTLRSIFSERIPFEALVEPERFLSNVDLKTQEPHPFGLSEIDYSTSWDGQGDQLFKKMSNNLLSEILDFFMKDGAPTTIASLEDQNPEFGNAESGSFYAMRIKMKRSRNKKNDFLGGIGGTKTIPPQDNYARTGVKESFTMYSRPTAFGPPVWGGPQDGEFWGAYDTKPLSDTHGNNYCYTPPYYYGEAWCDVLFECSETKKYTLDEILQQVKEFPYYTRYWWPGVNDALRDLTGYRDDAGAVNATDNSLYKKYQLAENPWLNLFNETGIDYVSGNVTHSDTRFSWLDNTYSEINNYTASVGWMSPYTLFKTGSLGTGGTSSQYMYVPQHPANVNYNAMQLDSSVNLFGKGTVRKIRDDDTGDLAEVASSDTIKGKTRWIIQSKFETPMLNFNKYTNLSDHNLTIPSFASESVPRGMWHQYGEIPEDPEVGVFLQVEDIPLNWMKGALGINKGLYQNKVKSLADLVGFSKDPVKLGQVSSVKEISEAVVAVPFIEKDGTRQFFSIPREDIDSCIEAVKREVEEGTFVAGGPAKAGDSVYQMVKKMQKYVFPPSMDFVKYKEVDPFAMYVFEFKHNLTKQDLADIWQNLPPEIGTRMEEAEATISHELLAHELLGGGAVVKNGILDDNAEGNGIPSNIQWMIFKAKKRAKTNYFDKVVAKKGTTEETSQAELEGITASIEGKDAKEITYNWPYDFFSLVELVKIDAEVTFANIENDDKGQKTIKKVEKKSPLEVSKTRAAARGINIARGKGKPKK